MIRRLRNIARAAGVPLAWSCLILAGLFAAIALYMAAFPIALAALFAWAAAWLFCAAQRDTGWRVTVLEDRE